MLYYKSKLDNYRLVRDKTDIYRAKIISSMDANNYIRIHIDNELLSVQETFGVLFLNAANNTIGITEISKGGINSTVVDKRIIAKYAINSLAKSIILFHNHPSGNMKPSEQDITITNEIKIALNMFDISVLDHVILSPDNKEFYSFTDEGLL